MNGRYLPSERLVSLFLFAVLLFSPPLILIFDSRSIVAGFPVLYLYLFIAWAILIVLLALVSELSFGPEDHPEQQSASEADISKPQRTEDA